MSLQFENTEIAFHRKSDKELWHTYRLFRIMGLEKLVNIGSSLMMLAFKLRLPIQSLVKKTMFYQFCGGTDLQDSMPRIDQLISDNIYTILDYGVEAASGEENYEKVIDVFKIIIDFASGNGKIPVVSCKLSGFARFDLLQKMTAQKKLSEKESREWERVKQRFDRLCNYSFSKNIGLFVDAEESWIQGAIDDLVKDAMLKYNKQRAIIIHTYQLYRHDRLKIFEQDLQWAIENKIILGAKLVRGAYMEKERDRAMDKEYPSPIHADKASVDQDFNAAMRIGLDHYEQVLLVAATHNEYSCKLLAEWIDERNLPNDHPNLNFCQLLGMSDHLTYNLANAGYNVGKYVPFGPVKDVVPYLIRRARENTSVGGQMGRELQLIKKEMRRRNLIKG